MSCVTGDETGMLKIWDISRAEGHTLQFSYGHQTRDRSITSMNWIDRDTTQILVSMKDGTLAHLDTTSELLLTTAQRNAVAATSTSLAVIRDHAVVVRKDGSILFTDWSDEHLPHGASDEERLAKTSVVKGFGPAEGVHISRRYGLAAIGGKDNDLRVWDLMTEAGRTEPLFTAKNVKDHVLGDALPVYVAATAVVSSHLFAVVTAYHQVRFYDRRVSERPVQEYAISREISRRPTSFLQWNCNKYLIGEASGDIHMYDTRRGFASRAKLRGGVGSVRHMVKHPGGTPVLCAVGLDRKARLFHPATGKMLASLYLKQKGFCCLLSRGDPFVRQFGGEDELRGSVNKKQAEAAQARAVVELWKEMEPAVDEFEDAAAANGKKAKKGNKIGEGDGEAGQQQGNSLRERFQKKTPAADASEKNAEEDEPEISFGQQESEMKKRVR